MGTIDPTARVEDGAVIGEGTTIGPYCIIGRNVVIGANCNLIAHVHVTAQTTIGAGCTIYPFVSLGTPPQSLSYKGELTRLEIGAGCTLLEAEDRLSDIRHEWFAQQSPTRRQELLAEAIQINERSQDQVQHKLDRLVDSYTHSYEVGAEKPDAAIFLAAAKSLGVKPSDTLMVGDHEVDRGAERAGMRVFILPAEFYGDVRGLAAVFDLLQ